MATMASSECTLLDGGGETPFTSRTTSERDLETGSPSDPSNTEARRPSKLAARAWNTYKLVFVTVSLLLAIFDLGADWWAVKDFFKYDGGNMTIALTFFISCSTVLFFMEVYNGVLSIQVYGFGKGDRDKVELWREFLSFGLLLLEDLPVTLTMYAAFREGNCQLYFRIFEESKVAKLALLAAFVSSMWKGVLSLKYCLQFICKENYTPWRNRRESEGRTDDDLLTITIQKAPKSHRSPSSPNTEIAQVQKERKPIFRSISLPAGSISKWKAKSTSKVSRFQPQLNGKVNIVDPLRLQENPTTRGSQSPLEPSCQGHSEDTHRQQQYGGPRGSRSRHRPSRQRSMTWQDRLFCCSCVRCRPLRIIINILVCLFTAYVFLTFTKKNIMDRRLDCAYLVHAPTMEESTYENSLTPNQAFFIFSTRPSDTLF